MTVEDSDPVPGHIRKRMDDLADEDVQIVPIKIVPMVSLEDEHVLIHARMMGREEGKDKKMDLLAAIIPLPVWAGCPKKMQDAIVMATVNATAYMVGSVADGLGGTGVLMNGDGELLDDQPGSEDPQ